ncbi:unnamed protein product [Owenia fusiformis]|uniref:Uncharacterized protein n=1 Tax=Owenia fusiformis TaxID=6347 RepID=A0A8S4Q211_OWEFU|nr:unnamed protein product [Owenia fusiformis]
MYFVSFQECKEQIPPPAGWSRGRPYLCWKVFESEAARDVHIACAHRPTEECGVGGCGASYCPNDVERLRLHRLRQHDMSLKDVEAPPHKSTQEHCPGEQP